MTEIRYPEIKPGSSRKSPTGRTLWCGPFALAILSGLPYDEAYRKALAVEQRRLNACAKARGLKPGYWTCKSIQGMQWAAVARTAERLGVKVGAKHTSRKAQAVTLLTFARDHTVRDKVYLVAAGNHYEVICNGILYHSHHDPMPIEDAPKFKKAKVTEWAEVRPAYC